MSKLLATLRAHANTALLICSCFLLASTGYLSWLYNITSTIGAENAEFHALVVGYLVQAAGIGTYILIARRNRTAMAHQVVTAALCLHVFALVPATTAGTPIIVLASGFALNAFYGIIQGYYLTILAAQVERKSRGTVFGCSYGASTLFTLLLSTPGDGFFKAGAPSVACCLGLTIAALLFMRKSNASNSTKQTLHEKYSANDELSTRRTPIKREATEPRPAGVMNLGRGGIALIVATIAAAGLVKTIGFSFPSADLASGVNLELSRVLYGVGLAAVGVIADRDRRLAMAICAAALVAPFLMLSLSGFGVVGLPLWLLGYLLSGVYVLFSVLTTADMASDARRPELAGGGMIARYVGDVAGTALCLALASAPTTLIAVSGVAFVLTAALFISLYRQMYSQPSDASDSEPEEREQFNLFAANHALTIRERDVLRLVLAEKSNSEIASELFITERTVKFHVSNLLKKTSCKTRIDLLAMYAEQSYELSHTAVH